MAFGNEDSIDGRHKARIRELENALAALLDAFTRSTSLTTNEKLAVTEIAASTLGRHVR